MLKAPAILEPGRTPPSLSIFCFEGFQLGFVHEHGQFARLAEISLRRPEGGGMNPVVALGRHVGEGGGEQGAADAVADAIGIA